MQVVATFWFKTGRIFIEATNRMISENDRINGEYYVDQVAKHALDIGYKVKVFGDRKIHRLGNSQ